MMECPLLQTRINAKPCQNSQQLAILRLTDPKLRLQIAQSIKKITSTLGLGLSPKKTSSTTASSNNNTTKTDNSYTLLDLNGSICLPHVSF